MVKFDGLKEEAQRNFIASSAYESKFYTSITVACGASLAAIISFSSNYTNKEQFFSSLILSLWCLFCGIVFSSCLPFILSFQHKHSGSANIAMANLGFLLSRVEKGHISEDSAVYKSAEQELEKSDKKSIFWRNIKVIFALVSIIFLLTGIAYPLYKITINGDLL